MGNCDECRHFVKRIGGSDHNGDRLQEFVCSEDTNISTARRKGIFGKKIEYLRWDKCDCFEPRIHCSDCEWFSRTMTTMADKFRFVYSCKIYGIQSADVFSERHDCKDYKVKKDD